MAIVHLAIYRAASAATEVRGAASPAAVAQAAHDTLVQLFPAQAVQLHALLADDLDAISGGAALRRGVLLGRINAAAMMALRRGDGSEAAEPKVGMDHLTSDQPGYWRQDPIGQSPLAMGAYWGAVRPFTMRSAAQFRAVPPPAMATDEYSVAYHEALRLGGDGIATATARSSEQTAIGIYWAYDGTPSLCAPPRLYNQLATTIAVQRRTEGMALARMLALINVAMADAGACKYYGPRWTAGYQTDAGNYLHSAGKKILFWTLDEPGFVFEFLNKANPDGFITNRPYMIFAIQQYR